KDVDPAILARDIERFRHWETDRATVTNRAASPSIQVQRATDATGVPDDSSPVTFVELPMIPNRPIGPRFGTLVHHILATVPLDANREVVAKTSEAEGRILAATEEEIAAATETVAAALRHPLLRRAHAADIHGALRREVPVALRPAQGIIIEGIVDLAFEENKELI